MPVETFTKLAEWVKFTTYEFLAVLVPGIIVFAAIRPTFDSIFGAQGGVIELLISAWVLGLATQGWARLVLGRRECRLIKGAAGEVRAACSAQVPHRLQSRLDKADALDAYCLAAVGERRADYEKFLALKDAARGTAVALPSALVIVFVAGGVHWTFSRMAGATLLVLVIAGGMLERWKRFAPLPQLSLYAEFLAAEERTTHK